MSTIFAKRMRQAMDMRSMKAVDLCKATGLKDSLISCYLAGRYRPKQDRTELIAIALNVSPAWLMGYTDDPTGHTHKDIPAAPIGYERLSDDQKLQIQNLVDFFLKQNK